jgi:hypothetical protein
VPIRIALYRANISYPYRFGVNISYDVTFEGFLRSSGNAWHSHPDDSPNNRHTFTIGRSGEKSADIRYQWAHRDEPAQAQWWDWNWAIENSGLENMQAVTGYALRPFHSYVSGNFSAESRFAGAINVGQPVEVETGANPGNAADGVEIVSDFDAGDLDSVGFSNAAFTVRSVEE